MHRTSTLTALAAALALPVAAVSAATTSVDVFGDVASSNEQTGADFEASLSYDDAAQQLTVALTNTTGFTSAITAFAFNLDADADVVLNEFLSRMSWVNLDGPIDTPGQFGLFSDGATTKASGNSTPKFNAGKVALGIADASTGTFVFDVSGSAAATLEAVDFIARNGADFGFVVRFQGIGSNDLSDVVPGQPMTPPSIIPTPAAAPAGLMLLGLLATRRRRTA